MAIFPFFRKKEFFPPEEKEQIVNAIRLAERQTSGEIRLYVESKCKYVDPLDRAKEIFNGLGMVNTKDRNAVLVYIATSDHQLAIFGDDGIYQKTGQEFWNQEVRKILGEFNRDHYAEGLAQIITDIGQALTFHFPYSKSDDKNELPDDIVFGK